MYVGFAVYAVGALLTASRRRLPLLLAARFVWGLGAAGPRTVTLAIVRDRYEGEEMSRAMSLIMAVFILVPVVAPTSARSASPWGRGAGCSSPARSSRGMTLWMTRMVESLAPEHRRELRSPG
jgi:MFS transporter, DHA1 family, multidrug resistance protein